MGKLKTFKTIILGLRLHYAPLYISIMNAGAYALSGKTLDWNGEMRLLYLATPLFIVVTIISLINDMFDRKIDEINMPGRLFPKRFLNVTFAVFLIVLCLLGLVYSSALLLNDKPMAILVLLICLFLSFLYSWKLKYLGTFGEILSIISTSTPLFYADIVVNQSIRQSSVLLFFLIIIFSYAAQCFHLVRDVEGDRLNNSRQIAVVKGVGVAIRRGLFFLVISIFLFLGFLLYANAAILGLAIVILADILVFYVAFKISKNPVRPYIDPVMGWIASAITINLVFLVL